MNNAELLDIAREYGTPLYVFDGRKLVERVDYLRSFLPSNVKVCYAVKANTFIIPLLEDVVDSFEICSTGEGRICLETGVDPDMMVISGVNKDADYIEELITEHPGVHRYTVESLHHWRMLCEIAERTNNEIDVLLRLTSGNQFGLDKSDLVSVVAERAEHPLVTIRGIQYFSGTQKTSTKRLARELRTVMKMVAKLEEQYDFTCEELEFGPGYPVIYFEDEAEENAFDEDAYMREFGTMLSELDFDGPITLEIGRGIAACCGTFLTSVVDAKVNAGQRYAIVDGGMNHIVYYGQSLAMHTPSCDLIFGAAAPEEGEPEVWNICGSLCSVNDILAKQLPLGRLTIGDILAFRKTGAYCMTEGISLFLSRDLPAVCLVDKDGNRRKVRGFDPTYPMNTPRIL